MKITKITLILFSILFTIILTSCPISSDDSGSDSGSGSGGDSTIKPLNSIRMDFTNDYKTQDEVTLSLGGCNIINKIASLPISTSDVSCSSSGNKHTIVLKIRPYYAHENILAGKVGVAVSTISSSVTSSIPANNELPIVSNTISFTASYEGTTHTYTIKLVRQDTKVTVDILNVGINNIYINAPTNAVNHLVNFFVHDSEEKVNYATALGYPTRTTRIAKAGFDSNHVIDSIGRYAYNTTKVPTNDDGNANTTTDGEASLPDFIMRSGTQYWLHVYYKDVHTNKEVKETYPFTTKSLPTATDVGSTPADYANTWAVGNGGYKPSNYMLAANPGAANRVPYYNSNGQRTTVGANTVTNYNTIAATITGYNYDHKLFQSWIITSNVVPTQFNFYQDTSNIAQCSLGNNTTGCATATNAKFFKINLGTNKEILYIYRVFSYDHNIYDVNYSAKVTIPTTGGGTSTVNITGYSFDTGAIFRPGAWAITSATDFTPVRSLSP